jgi:hypothetical protein
MSGSSLSHEDAKHGGIDQASSAQHDRRSKSFVTKRSALVAGSAVI